MNKSNALGFSDNALALIASYLSNRIQYVYHNGHKSFEYTLESGVPQGSNLGPLLFVIYINDLLEKMSCPVLAYADDIKLYATIKNNDIINFQANLDNLFNWCSVNNLYLNINKCCVVIYIRTKTLCVSSYNVNGDQLRSENSIKDLGVTFDSQFRFNEHIERICACATRMLGLIIRVSREFSDLGVIKLLFHAYVLSRLEYAVLIWYPRCNAHVFDVDRILRRFTKFLSYKIDKVYPAQGCSMDSLLQRHNIQDLAVRRERICAKFLYNLIHFRIDCSELLNKIPFNIPRHNNRNNSTFYLPKSKSNVMKYSPLFIMCNAAEDTFNDIFL